MGVPVDESLPFVVDEVAVAEEPSLEACLAAFSAWRFALEAETGIVVYELRKENKEGVVAAAVVCGWD